MGKTSKYALKRSTDTTIMLKSIIKIVGDFWEISFNPSEKKPRKILGSTSKLE